MKNWNETSRKRNNKAANKSNIFCSTDEIDLMMLFIISILIFHLQALPNYFHIDLIV